MVREDLLERVLSIQEMINAKNQDTEEHEMITEEDLYKSGLSIPEVIGKCKDPRRLEA